MPILRHGVTHSHLTKINTIYYIWEWKNRWHSEQCEPPLYIIRVGKRKVVYSLTQRSGFANEMRVANKMRLFGNIIDEQWAIGDRRRGWQSRLAYF